jgi:hypothetical protein
MNAVMKAAVIAFAETAGGRIGVVARRSTAAALCAVSAAAFAAAAVGCAVAALWIFVLPAVGPVGAPAIAAAALLLLCLALLAAVRMILRRQPAPARAAIGAGGMPSSLIADLSRLFDDNKCAALLAALMAGANAARSQKQDDAGRRTTR